MISEKGIKSNDLNIPFHCEEDKIRTEAGAAIDSKWGVNVLRKKNKVPIICEAQKNEI